MPDSLKLNVVGWRHVTHSFAIINQWQILSLLRRADVVLTHDDAPLARPDWRHETGAFGPEDTAKISAVPSSGADFDVEYRLSFPFDLSASTKPALVFGVTENWQFPENYVRGGRLGEVNDREAMRVVVPSSWARNGFVAAGVEAGRIDIVPHGVDTSTFHFDPALRKNARRELGLTKFVFLNVGSLVGTKGSDLLLDAFGIVLERGVDATLLLKGSDELYHSKARLKALLDKLSPTRRQLVLSNLKYIGKPLDMRWMAGLYNAADAYVSPYLAEGFNMPVLEAAAVGLPILATDGGATDDFTTEMFRRKIVAGLDTSNGKTRLRPDRDSLVDLMTAVVDDRNFAEQARVHGPTHVAERYRWDQVVDQLVTIAKGVA